MKRHQKSTAPRAAIDPCPAPDERFDCLASLAPSSDRLPGRVVLAVWTLGLIVFAGGCKPGRESRLAEVLRRARAAPERVADLEAPYLSDTDRDVRALAVWAIGEAASGEATPKLVPLVGDADEAVRRSVAIALCRTGGEGAIESLTRLSSDADPEVRREAVRCFAAMDSSPAEPLVRALGDDDAATRVAALEAIRRRPLPEALGALAAVVRRRGPAEQSRAVAAILAIGDPGRCPISKRRRARGSIQGSGTISKKRSSRFAASGTPPPLTELPEPTRPRPMRRKRGKNKAGRGRPSAGREKRGGRF
jgi:hypothetical protein